MCSLRQSVFMHQVGGLLAFRKNSVNVLSSYKQTSNYISLISCGGVMMIVMTNILMMNKTHLRFSFLFFSMMYAFPTAPSPKAGFTM